MVKKEEVEKLMLRHFPLCPLCGADKGYEVSGVFKNWVQCRSCGAKWLVSFPSRKREEIAALQLSKPSPDDRGSSLKKKPYSVTFWQNSQAIEKLIETKEKAKADQLMVHYFSSCPLCGASAGYEVSGVFKDFVQCRSCGAKWHSSDFTEGKLESLQLWESSRDGRGASLKKKRFLVKFWQDSDAIEKLLEEKERRKGPEEEKRAKEIEGLFRKLKTKDAKVRSEVQNRLREIGQPVFEKIKEMSEANYSGTRKEASVILGLMEVEEGVEVLIQVLKSDVDEGVRCQAVASLGLIEEGKRTGKAIEPLIEALKNDVRPNVRATAAMVLGFIKGPRAIDALIQALRDSSATVPGLLKRLTLTALGARWFGPSVGQTAAMSLVKIGKPAVNPLTQALKKTDILDTYMRKQAEEVLRKIRARTVETRAYVRELKNEDKLVRRKAAEALGKLGDSKAAEPLIQALKDEDWRVREKVVEALGKIKDPRAVEPLTQALKDEKAIVRQRAASALGNTGDERALEALTQAKEDRDVNVRSAARAALKKIQKK